MSYLRAPLLLFALLLLAACNNDQSPAVTASVQEGSSVDASPEAPAAETSERKELDIVVETPDAPAAPPEQEVIKPATAPVAQTIQKPAKDATVTRDKPVVEPAPTPPAVTPAQPAATAPSTPTAPATAPPAEPAEAPAIVPIEAPTAAAKPIAPDHSSWNSLLQKHVTSSGKVNYAGFKKDKATLDAYLAKLAESIPQSDWGRKTSLAFWINAYNAFTVKRILKDYPVNSITDLDGGDPWKVKWITLDGKSYSLNNIEHDIIRPRFQEPRIHFAVNCAATSCPPIPNQAFTAGNLNAMLESGTRRFINNPAYNQTEGNIKVSKIFDWYGEDFGDLRTYLNQYLKTPIAEGTEIGFKEYDWALNKQ